MMSVNSTLPATKRLILKVTLLSDLHSGSGWGGAEIDALLVRDQKGNPYIRWSHLKGLLIEACRERYSALGKSLEGKNHIKRLFGAEDALGQARGQVLGRSLRITTASAKPTLIWSSTARQEDERAPKDDTLRREEYLPAGTELEGELRLPANPDDVNLICKLIGRITHLGGHRSRGAGLVHINSTQQNIEAAQLGSDNRQGISNTTAKTGWHTLRVSLQALEPVCLAATGQPGNIIPSHSDIGPTGVKGMLARWALDSKLDQLADALLDGSIVCAAAYPVPAASIACADALKLDAVPIPLSFQSTKPTGQKGTLPWWAGKPSTRAISNALDSRQPTEKLKRPSVHDYLYTNDGGLTWDLFTCPLGTSMRNNTGSSLKQGVKQDLFATEEIAADTGFVTHLLVSHENLPLARAMLDDLKEKGRWLRIGRGGAPAIVQGWADITVPDGQPITKSVNNSSLTLFVESDLILRATDLSFHTRLDTGAMQTLLKEAGIEVSIWRSVAVINEVSEPIHVHGWNIANGGPRLPAIAIRRGSIARIECGSSENAEIIHRALLDFGPLGSGERVTEGYGRIRIGFEPDITEQPNDTYSVWPQRQEEACLAEVTKWLEDPDFPDYFPTSRWQSLRQLAGTNRLDEWFKRANRQVKDKKGKIWLPKLESKKSDVAFMRALGLTAAKTKQANGREKEEFQDVAE
jgi:hypothetical protein